MFRRIGAVGDCCSLDFCGDEESGDKSDEAAAAAAAAAWAFFFALRLETRGTEYMGTGGCAYATHIFCVDLSRTGDVGTR